jgi:hypothetical protein
MLAVDRRVDVRWSGERGVQADVARVEFGAQRVHFGVHRGDDGEKGESSDGDGMAEAWTDDFDVCGGDFNVGGSDEALFTRRGGVDEWLFDVSAGLRSRRRAVFERRRVDFFNVYVRRICVYVCGRHVEHGCARKVIARVEKPRRVKRRLGNSSNGWKTRT